MIEGQGNDKESANLELVDAIVEGRRDRVLSALKKGADPSYTLYDSVPATFIAGLMGHRDILTDLVSHGASVDTRDHKNRTMLMYLAPIARTPKQLQVVKYLINSHINVDARDDYHQGALDDALVYWNPPVAKLLYEAGATVRPTNREHPLLTKISQSQGRAC